MVFPGTGEIINVVWQIFLTPFKEPAILWEVAPFILLWFSMEIYFGTHKKEKLGWNSALANGVSLFWVIISGMQHIFLNGMKHFTWSRFIILLCLTMYALFIIFTSFRHGLSKRFEFLIASPSPMYYFSLIALFFAYDLLSFSWLTIVGIFILYIAIMIFFTILRLILPELKEDDDSFDDNNFSEKKSRRKKKHSEDKDDTNIPDLPAVDDKPFNFDEALPGDSIDSLANETTFNEKDLKF